MKVSSMSPPLPPLAFSSLPSLLENLFFFLCHLDDFHVRHRLRHRHLLLGSRCPQHPKRLVQPLAGLGLPNGDRQCRLPAGCCRARVGSGPMVANVDGVCVVIFGVLTADWIVRHRRLLLTRRLWAQPAAGQQLLQHCEYYMDSFSGMN